jgi:aryl-alcohol dehydrogenase-like predicted oxidoreductase
MERRRIGSLEVTLVGLGCNNFGWRIDEAASRAVVDAALDAGINFFDTADIYDKGTSEEYLGRALGARRGDVVIATKFGKPMDERRHGGKAAYVREALEASLRRLGTDYVDLYQMHSPDPATPVEETLGALEELVRAGKVREVGCSNFSAAQLRESEGRWASVQNHYSLYTRTPEEDGVLEECRRQGIAMIPYFPLESGLLTGKYRPGQPPPRGSRGDAAWGPKVYTERNLEWVERLRGFAEQRGHTAVELAMSWLSAQPAVASIIAGATTPEQVRANAASANWRMTAEEVAEISAMRP